MTCKDFEAALQALLDGEALPEGLEGEADHLDECPSCRIRASEMVDFHEALARSLGPCPPEVSLRIREAVRAADEGLRAPGTARVEAARRRIESIGAPPRRRKAWMALEAAAVLLVVLGAWLALRPSTDPAPAVVPDPPTARIDSPPLEPRPLPIPLVPREPEPPPPPLPLPPLPPPPAPEPPKPAPLPVPPAPAPKPVEPAPATVPAPARAVAVELRRGALSGRVEGQWVKGQPPLEGMALRAEGSVRLDFAGAALAVEDATQFSLAKDDLSLLQGGLSVEIPPGSPFVLVSGPARIAPAAPGSRVLLAARQDRLLVEEGAAKSGVQILHEGVEYRRDRASLVALDRRTVPPAEARPRETVVWKLPIDPTKSAAQKLEDGQVELLEGRPVLAMRSRATVTLAPEAGPAGAAAAGRRIGVTAGGASGLFIMNTGTALRFRYFVVRSGAVTLSLHNQTKKADFTLDLDPVVGHWTTITLPLRDIPAAAAAGKVACDPGDRLWNVRWEADPTSGLLLDRVEVVEIRR